MLPSPPLRGARGEELPESAPALVPTATTHFLGKLLALCYPHHTATRASRAPRLGGPRQHAAPLAEARTMHWAFWVMWSIVAVASPAAPRLRKPTCRPPTTNRPCTAGLTVDCAGPAGVLPPASRLAVDATELQALTRQPERPRHRGPHAGRGPSWLAGPPLYPRCGDAANGLTNPVAAEHARQCLQRLEGGEAVNLPIAATRLLGLEAARRRPGAAGLPAVRRGRQRRRTRRHDPGGPGLRQRAARPVLVRALEDPLPLRRAAAAGAACVAPTARTCGPLRKLLQDPRRGGSPASAWS